jgi:phosphocarrier protein
MKMIEKKLIIKNRTGLHARPAAVFVEIADRFEADINLTFDGVTVNAKSIIGVLSLGIGKDDEITLSIDGADEEEAMDALVEIIENQFGETEV